MLTVKRPDLITVIEIYRSPRVTLSSLLVAICATLYENPSSGIIIIGDFNVNWSDEVERRSLYNLTIKENGHGYTNLITEEAQAGVLETYF